MIPANEPRRVLQLEGRATADSIERAYAASRTRYLRLTARDPLHYYRRRLLNDAEAAYRRLRTPSAPIVPARKSILQQQAAKKTSLDFRTPLRSAVTEKNLIASRPLTVTARTLLGQRELKRSKREEALIEDDFCREVFYRLEGDLLRYTSRRELLGLAQQFGLHPFRANFLMAQIVECVRQGPTQKTGVGNQNFKNGTQEKKMNESFLNRRRLMLWAGLIGLVLLLCIDAFLLEAFYRAH